MTDKKPDAGQLVHVDDQDDAGQLVHVDDEAVAAELEIPAAVGPDGSVCVVRGQFALYQRGGGGMEVFFDVGAGLERKTIPGPVVKMLMGTGPMAGMLRRAFDGGSR
jgi:hypothetical protein